MKHIYKTAFIALSALTLLQSCKKALQEVNTNPNATNDTRPEFMFTNATLNYSKIGRGDYTERYSTTMTFMQYMVQDASGKEGLESAYNAPGKTTFANSNYPLYGPFYSNYGRDLARVIAKIEGLTDPLIKDGYKDLASFSKILLTYNAWKVSDVYGALPYTQAFNPTQFPLPAYDYDYNLYKLYDTQLKAAVDELRSNTSAQKDIKNNDFYYAGVKANWIKFANTLRIKIAQRYEKRDPQNLTAVVTDIGTNYGNQIISSNAEAFGYNHPQDFEGNPDELNRIVNQYVAGYPFVEFLKSTQDPRIVFMIRENDFGTNYERYKTIKEKGNAQAQADLNRPDVLASRFWGKHVFPASTDASYGWTGTSKNQSFTITNGNSTSTLTLSFQSNLQSRLFVKNGAFRGGDAALHTDELTPSHLTLKVRTQLLSYAETCFMMAEIAEKSGTGLGKTAAEWYNAGVTASFDEYKARAVAANVPNASTATLGTLLTRIPYNGLPSIYSQAWVNFLIQPEEAWAMWKRTGYPQFTDFRPGQPSLIGNGSGIAYLENLWNGSVNLDIPRRGVLSPPAAENAANFDKAIADMKAKDANYGINNLDTRGRIWWDKQ